MSGRTSVFGCEHCARQSEDLRSLKGLTVLSLDSNYLPTKVSRSATSQTRVVTQRTKRRNTTDSENEIALNPMVRNGFKTG